MRAVHPRHDLRYPLSVTRLISLLCLILLLAAFTPSAIRLYVIGSRTFGQAVPNNLAQVAVGLATVLSAEIGQVAFLLVLATLDTSSTSRRLLYLSMGMCTSVALAGNIQVALLGHEPNVFAWLEAIVPPLVVLSTAYVLKGQMLETIEQRHAAEYAYQSALADWQVMTAEPEETEQPAHSTLASDEVSSPRSNGNSVTSKVIAAASGAV